MSKPYGQLKIDAEQIVKIRNPNASRDMKEELVWMYIQGYIASMQEANDNARKASSDVKTSQFNDFNWYDNGGPYS